MKVSLTQRLVNNCTSIWYAASLVYIVRIGGHTMLCPHSKSTIVLPLFNNCSQDKFPMPLHSFNLNKQRKNIYVSVAQPANLGQCKRGVEISGADLTVQRGAGADEAGWPGTEAGGSGGTRRAAGAIGGPAAATGKAGGRAVAARCRGRGSPAAGPCSGWRSPAALLLE